MASTDTSKHGSEEDIGSLIKDGEVSTGPAPTSEVHTRARVASGDNDGESFDLVPVENRRISTTSALLLIANRVIGTASFAL